MPSEKNKWIDAVGKLITLTQERKLLWRNAGQTYEADYGGKLLRLYSIADGYDRITELRLMEPGTGAEWTFPSSEANEHLMEAVRYQIVGVGEFLDDLLAEAV